jgi:D-alanyl-D-alanine endopeptidase (penicillin-binding protein 7)
MRILTFILLLCLAITGAQAKGKIIKAEPVPVVYAVWNVANSELIDSKNENMVHSIASMTKLMTVYTTLNSGVDLQERVTVVGREGSSRIRSGMIMSRHELIELALVSSDNLAARTLAETHPRGYDAFIVEMNAHAMMLGMFNTHYDDATGLMPTNVSSASEMMKLVLAARKYDVYHEAAMSPSTEVTATFKQKMRIIKATSTNQFAGKMDIEVAKTGFTNHAGRCLTMLFHEAGNTYALVVMGATSPPQRKQIVDRLIDVAKVNAKSKINFSEIRDNSVKL